MTVLASRRREELPLRLIPLACGLTLPLSASEVSSGVGDHFSVPPSTHRADLDLFMRRDELLSQLLNLLGDLSLTHVRRSASDCSGDFSVIGSPISTMLDIDWYKLRDDQSRLILLCDFPDIDLLKSFDD